MENSSKGLRRIRLLLSDFKFIVAHIKFAVFGLVESLADLVQLILELLLRQH